MTEQEKISTNISNINDFMHMRSNTLILPKSKEIEVKVEKVEPKAKKSTSKSWESKELPEELQTRKFKSLELVEQAEAKVDKKDKKDKRAKVETDFKKILTDIKDLNRTNATVFTAEQFLYVLYKRNEKVNGKIFLGNMIPETEESAETFKNNNVFTNNFSDFLRNMKQGFNQENYYITPNYFTPKMGEDYSRKIVANVKGLNTMFLDIDYLKAGQTLENTLNAVLDSKWIQPSAIVNTGNGLQVYYHLTDPIFLTADNRKGSIKFYIEVQKAMIAKFKDFGADSAVSFTNYLRLPDSYNVKEESATIENYGGKKEVKCIMLNLNTYSLYELSDCFNHGAYEQVMEEKAKREEEKEANKSKRETKKQKIGRKSANANGHTYESGIQARVSDLFELVRLRKGHVTSRNDFLNQMIFYDIKQVKELNKLFANPEDESKIDNLIEYYLRQLEIKPSLRKLSKWTSEVLIERLEITEEEQKHLSHIISDKEKARRKAIRRKKQRELPARARKLNREIKTQIIKKSWRSKSKTNAEWAKMLNVSESTVKNLKRDAKVMMDADTAWEYDTETLGEIFELLNLSPAIVDRSKKANIVKNIENKGYFSEVTKKDLVQLMKFFEKVGQMKVS